MDFFEFRCLFDIEDGFMRVKTLFCIRIIFINRCCFVVIKNSLDFFVKDINEND